MIQSIRYAVRRLRQRRSAAAIVRPDHYSTVRPELEEPKPDFVDGFLGDQKIKRFRLRCCRIGSDVVYYVYTGCFAAEMTGVNTMKRILSVLFCLLMIVLTATPAFADEAQVIHEVRLTITEPTVGAAPDKNIVPAEPDKYTVKYLYWIKRMYPDEPVEAFEAGNEYALVFDVYPADGYKFAATEKDANGTAHSATVVFLNDQQTEYCTYEYETKLGRAYVVSFAAEGEKPVSLCRRILNAIKGFFARIAVFVKSLFGIKV